MKNNTYRGQISKMLNLDPMSDMVNVEDDQPEMIFGPTYNGESPDSDVPQCHVRFWSFSQSHAQGYHG